MLNEAYQRFVQRC